MKIVLLITWLLLSTAAFATEDKYDSRYCKDPVELQKWAIMIDDNPDSDIVAALHGLWIGLCLKVEAHTLTTQRANKIFEDFKWGIIESIQAERQPPEKELT